MKVNAVMGYGLIGFKMLLWLSGVLVMSRMLWLLSNILVGSKSSCTRLTRYLRSSISSSSAMSSAVRLGLASLPC
jgi:hypothetical protein